MNGVRTKYRSITGKCQIQTISGSITGFLQVSFKYFCLYFTIYSPLQVLKYRLLPIYFYSTFVYRQINCPCMNRFFGVNDFFPIAIIFFQPFFFAFTTNLLYLTFYVKHFYLNNILIRMRFFYEYNFNSNNFQIPILPVSPNVLSPLNHYLRSCSYKRHNEQEIVSHPQVFCLDKFL